MHDLLRPHDLAAEGLADALVAQAYAQDGLARAELRVIEDVERLGSQLQGRAHDPPLLDDREVGVVEARPGHPVPGGVAEVVGADREGEDRARRAGAGHPRIAHRSGVPLLRSFEDLEVADQVGPDRVRDPVEVL